MGHLATLLARILWSHQWQAGEPGTRTCLVCDRCELMSFDDWGPAPTVIRPGDKRKLYARVE